MRSFDLFDTLIGRKCGTNVLMFKQMADKINDPQFMEDRISAERVLQEKKVEYDLSDIYREYLKICTKSERERTLPVAYYTNLEYLFEMDNVFPIKRYANRLLSDDIIITDMYLGEAELRGLIKRAGIKWEGKIYQSCYGKHSGTIWPEVIAKHHPTFHIGDNRYSDVASPAGHGLRGELAVTGLTELERDISFQNKDLAYWLRFHRLMEVDPTSKDKSEILIGLQISVNMPMLISAALLLNDYVEKNGIKKLLFMSRDTNLLYELWKKMYPTKAEYIWTSRDAFVNASESYMKYLNSKLKKNTLLVDLCASGNSLTQALPHLKIKPKFWTLVFLSSWGVSMEGIDLDYAVTNEEVRINNTYLEMLNYAEHLHIKDVKNNQPIYDLEGEYDMELVKEYRFIFKWMLRDFPQGIKFLEENLYPKDIIKSCLAEIQKNIPFLNSVFPQHVVFERHRKRDLDLQKAIPPTRVNQGPNPDVIVVGAIHTYHWRNIAPWWKSLQLVGIKNINMLTYYGVDHFTTKTMKEKKIWVFECKQETQVVVDRFLHLHHFIKSVLGKLYLRKNPWIIFPDVGDIVFQLNPQEFLSQVDKNKQIVVASEGVTFEGNSWARNNLKESFPWEWDFMHNKPIYNAGSIAARADILEELALEVYRMSLSAEPGATKQDQAALNILLQRRYQKQTLFTDPNDKWCFCGASSIFAKPSDAKNYTGKPVRVTNGLCFVEPGVLTTMFHHYTRSPNTKKLVQSRVNQEYNRRFDGN